MNCVCGYKHEDVTTVGKFIRFQNNHHDVNGDVFRLYACPCCGTVKAVTPLEAKEYDWIYNNME